MSFKHIFAIPSLLPILIAFALAALPTRPARANQPSSGKPNTSQRNTSQPDTGKPGTSQPNNFILLIPHTIPAESVDPMIAPALSRLRADGVYFANSHTGFPQSTGRRASIRQLWEEDSFHAKHLIDAAMAGMASDGGPQYLTAVVNGASGVVDGVPVVIDGKPALGALPPELTNTGQRAEQTNPDPLTGHRAVLDLIMPALKNAARPFLLIYRFGALPPEASGASYAAMSNMAPGASAGIGDRAETDNSAETGHITEARNSGDTSNGADTTETIISTRPQSEFPDPTAAIAHADAVLADLEIMLGALKLSKTTNVIVAAEQGSAAVWKGSKTSPAAGMTFPDVPPRELPPGFLAIDLITALRKVTPSLSLYDRELGGELVDPAAGQHPSTGDAIIGTSLQKQNITIDARGGHAFLHLNTRLTKSEAAFLGKSIVDILLAQDYVGGVFIDERRLGELPGALSIRHLGWEEGSVWDVPDIVVSFVSVSMGCSRPTACAAIIADTAMPQWQPTGGAFSRAHTWVYMAARGPDFQRDATSRVPASHADITRTIAHLLRLDPTKTRPTASWQRVTRKEFAGRVLSEALRGNEGRKPPRVRKRTILSEPWVNGVRTELHLQSVGETQYFVAAGTAGWTVGIPPRPAPVEWRPWRWDWPKPKAFSVTIDSGDSPRGSSGDRSGRGDRGGPERVPH